MAVENNSDNRRIEEMNRAAYNRKLDTERRGDKARRAQAFQQVMTEKAGREAARQDVRGKQAAEQDKRSAAKKTLQQAKKRPAADPRRPVDPRRAAFARGQLGRTAKARVAEHQATNAAETERAEASLGEQRERVSETEEKSKRKDEQELIRREEKQAEVQKEQQTVIQGQDERGGRGRQQQGQPQGRGQERAAEIAAAEGTARARPSLPPEVLKQLVHTIYQATKADGRTSLQLTLKGGMMDGVRLEVQSEGGEVRCHFGGCSAKLAKLLNDGQPALKSALARRGLKLTALEASAVDPTAPA